MKNHDLRPIDSQAFLEANAIHILIVEIIEEARKAVVTSIMVVTSIQNNKATKLDATSSGTSIISIVKKILQKEKC